MHDFPESVKQKFHGVDEPIFEPHEQHSAHFTGYPNGVREFLSKSRLWRSTGSKQFLPGFFRGTFILGSYLPI